MSISAFFGIGLLLCLLQALLSMNVQNRFLKHLPVTAMVLGVLFSLVLYLSAFFTGSSSVAAENQYFALFIGIPFAAGLAGAVLGLAVAKRRNTF